MVTCLKKLHFILYLENDSLLVGANSYFMYFFFYVRAISISTKKYSFRSVRFTVSVMKHKLPTQFSWEWTEKCSVGREDTQLILETSDKKRLSNEKWAM